MALIPGVEDLDALALFVSVVELGSLSQAGARHGVSQPAASTRLARLERRMGLQLLDRSTAGCTPTPAGAAVVEWSRELLAAAEHMGRALDTLRGSPDGVSIAASLTIAEHLLPSWLAVLHTDRPSTKVKVTVANSATVIELVRHGTVSLGFVETTEPTAGLKRRIVARDCLAVVVTARHPWSRRRTPLQPRQLADTAMVLREPGSGTRATLTSALDRLGLVLADPVLELASTAAVRNAVAAGVAPTVISELAIVDDVRAGRLVTIPVNGLDLTRPLVAIWRGSPPPVLRWLGRSTSEPVSDV
jgi:DNA-binding transcriptional LysR family regulator